jgi:hypothetical protein
LIQADGTVQSRMRVSWTQVTDISVQQDGQIEVQYRAAGSSGAWSSLIVPGNETTVATTEVLDFETYIVRARCKTKLAVSDWSAQVLHQVASKTIAPTAPTATATGGMFQVVVAWTFGDTAVDVRGTEVWWAAANDRAGAARLTFEPFPATSYPHIGLSAGQGGYYWVRVSDTNSNLSAWYPSSSTGGLHGVASADTTALLTQLTNSLGVGQLAADLATPINNIPFESAMAAANATNSAHTDLHNAIDTFTGQQSALVLSGTVAQISTDVQTNATMTGAIVTSVTNLYANGPAGYSAVKISALASSDAITGLQAQYSLKVDAGGHVAGISLATDASLGSSVVFLADKFAFVAPDGTGTPKTVMSVGNIAGVPTFGMNGNMIVDGTIVARSISAGTITATQISSNTITADLIISASCTSFERGSVDLVNGTWYPQSLYMDHAGYVNVIYQTNFVFATSSGTYSWEARCAFNSTTNFDWQSGSFVSPGGTPSAGVQVAAYLIAGWHTLYLYSYHSGATGSHYGYTTILKSYR